MKRKAKVLIIDDEPSICQMYKIGLESEEIKVLTACDGQTGLEIAQKEIPNLILLDIIMPKLNGFDILKLLKDNPVTKEIPVFLLTNLPQESGGEKGTQLGAAGYLVKANYEPVVLAKMIKGLVNK